MRGLFLFFFRLSVVVFVAACAFWLNAAAAANCANGYYWNGSACLDCGAGYYCNNDIRYNCLDINPHPYLTQANTAVDGIWFSPNAWAAGHCLCYWYFPDSPARVQYMNEAPCLAGPGGNSFTYGIWCNPGYYPINPLGYYSWYTDCAACTNKPANSHYTGYGSDWYYVDGEQNDCPWQCDSGFYRSGNSCVACPPQPAKSFETDIQSPIYITSDGARTNATDCLITGMYYWTGIGYWVAGTDGQTAGGRTCRWGGSDYDDCVKSFHTCVPGYGISEMSAGASFTNSCAPCPAGTSGPEDYPTQVLKDGTVIHRRMYALSCPACDAGTYQPSAGQASCAACPAGTYQPNTGQTSCTCVGNDYWAGAGSTTRNACLTNTKSGGCGSGAASASDCTPYKTLRNSQTANAPILRTVRTAPAGHNLNVSIDGVIYYGNLTETLIPGAIKLEFNGTVYSVTDNATQ